jgi:hypothetical protein
LSVEITRTFLPTVCMGKKKKEKRKANKGGWDFVTKSYWFWCFSFFFLVLTQHSWRVQPHQCSCSSPESWNQRQS